MRNRVLLFAIATLCYAQAPVKTARDQATLDQYVHQVFGPTVQLKISALKPSASLPGFLQATIHGSGDAFDQVRPILSRFLVKNMIFKGEGFSVEMKLTSPQNLEAMRVPHESYTFDVQVFVSADGQRILIGEVFDIAPKTPVGSKAK